MRQHKLVSTVLKQLARLGDTAAEVAASLIEAECKGDDTGDGHPIAVFIQRMKLPGVISKIVEKGEFLLIDVNLDQYHIPLPPACVEFDRLFRNGAFPELEEGLFR